MADHQVIIVVPVYRPICTDTELISIKQLLRVLNRYPIALVTPCSFDVSQYVAIFSDYSVTFEHVRFPDFFFDGVAGYNRLLLSELFYKPFGQYEYMLIYQLDAYVFTDDLHYWCNKHYDFIGAPLVGTYTDSEFSDSLIVGNGGFSLRRLAPILNYFNSRRNVFSVSQIVEKINLKKKPHTRVFVLLFMLMGWRNKPKTVATRWKYNEDDFWSIYLGNSRYCLSKPSPEEACSFAFERFPSSLFKKNSNKLPFGCHAWMKYEFESFWKEYITVNID